MPALTDDQLASAALRLERRAERDVTADLAAGVKVVTTLIGRALLAGDMTEAGLESVRAHILAALQAIRPDMASALSDYVDESITLGMRQALRDLPRERVRQRPLLPAVAPSSVLEAAVTAIDVKALSRLTEAIRMTADLPINPDTLRLVQGAAWRSLNESQGTVRWVTNRAVNLGTTRVATQRGMSTIWVPERDACLHCLAYAGHVAPADGAFPAGLTFGDKPLHNDPVPSPPLHPRCRCRVKPYDGPSGDPDIDQPTATLADALMKEAQRSVARGFTNYASQPAMLRAVERLLATDNALPKSVARRAARDLERGEFSGRHNDSPGLRTLPRGVPGEVPKKPQRA